MAALTGLLNNHLQKTQQEGNDLMLVLYWSQLVSSNTTLRAEFESAYVVFLGFHKNIQLGAEKWLCFQENGTIFMTNTCVMYEKTGLFRTNTCVIYEKTHREHHDWK